MVMRDHPVLSLSRQCRLLSIGRSSLYYEPKGESVETLALMRRIDELFLKYPFYGARRPAASTTPTGARNTPPKPIGPCSEITAWSARWGAAAIPTTTP